ncbi:MAG: EscU/YscU/HrcU family type III secretion system export apparatus switch protein [Bdellovibrionota bacterium]
MGEDSVNDSDTDNTPGEPKKRQKAVALQYAEGDRAPKIVATGAGEIARRILALAEEHNIPVKRDDALVDILSKLDLGYEIPEETYRAVAEILAFLYRTDLAWRKRKELEHPEMANPRKK